MSATIRADGFDWPLETYLDARGYRRLDDWDMPRLDTQVRVETVTRTGELAPARYAGDIRWADILAYRPLEGAPEGTPCRLCGNPCARLDDDVCEPCEADAEPWW